MGYTHGKTAQPATTMLTVDQARRLNAELRRELAALMTEQAELAPKVEAMRKEVTAASKKLTRQVRDLETIRSQTARLAAQAEQQRSLPAPVYGGEEGLLAATEEIEAYEGDKLGTVKRREPRHGTGRMYSTGCRCEDCLGWRKKRSDAERATQQRRREELQALRVQAGVAA